MEENLKMNQRRKKKLYTKRIKKYWYAGYKVLSEGESYFAIKPNSKCDVSVKVEFTKAN